MGTNLGPWRILMTASVDEEAWEQSMDLVRGLSAADIEVVLAVPGARPDQRQLTAATCIDGVEVALSPFRGDRIMATPPPDPGDWLLDLEADRRCDLVHLYGYEHGGLPFRGPKLIVGASCGLTWWRAVKGGDVPPVADAYRRKVSAALATADCVVAPSAWLLAALEEHYGPLPASVVIPAGRAITGFTPGDKQPFVLGVGSLVDDARNTALLARLAGGLPWPVKIAGASGTIDGGGGRPGLDDPHGALSLGRLSAERLATLFGAAAIYACPSRFESFGLSVHDAALSECALVLADLPSLRETWAGAAVFVPPDDEDAWQTALCTLMNQPELAALLALRARQRAACYSATRMVKSYLAAYRNLLAQRPAARARGLQAASFS